MRRDPLERISIRAALAAGFGLLVGLWLTTGWAFSDRLADLEAQTSAVTARYITDQDLLGTVRTQINISSIILRDALLDPDASRSTLYEERLNRNYATLVEALDSYEPVLEPTAPSVELQRLRSEVEVFWETTRRVLHHDAAGVSRLQLFEEQIAPRRAAAIALSDEIRDLNQQAFLEHRAAVAGIYRDGERQWWWRFSLALVASLAIAVAAILYAGRLEDRLRQQRSREQQTARELQRLSARLVSAQEEERRVIARELHDEVGQVLGAIKVDLALAERALEQQGVDARLLAEPRQMADGALRTVRDLSQLLRPAVLDDLGLAPAVDFLLRSLARRHHLQVALVQDGPVPRLPPAIEVAAFRVIQEALTNTARHAGASRCTVRLASDAAHLTVRIEDDGRGFNPGEVNPADGRGVGLVGMRERVAERGGTFELTSAPGQGTAILVRLPLDAGPPSAAGRADYGSLDVIGVPAQPSGASRG